MSERPRRRSRRDAMDSSSSFPTASTSTSTTTLKQGKGAKRFSKPSKERWLLTRKTWRYMADAGRRLIPDGTHNRPEDIPKIEQYFQQVCQKEPKFLLWRKSSYPGTTLGSFRCARKRHRLVSSCRAKAPSSASADEAEIESLKKLQDAAGKFDLHLTGESGRFDLTRVKKELLATGVSSTPSSPSSTRYETRGLEEDADARVLADMLRRYLNLQKSEEVLKPGFDHRSLVEKLQRHLDSIVPSEEGRFDVPRGSASPYEGDFVHKSLIETLSRYYSKSPTREHVITNILTDRKLLEKLYFDLRCTRGFRTPVRSPAGGTFGVPSDSRWLLSPTGSRTRTRAGEGGDLVAKDGLHQVPPLISVQEPSTDRGLAFDQEAQTDPIPKETLDGLLLELKEREEKKSDEDTGQRKKSSGGRRRSSVDNDDVSPSVSSTIKRYLRMARKKSVDSDKADRFKRVNYDRNLRNIKPKGNFEDDDDDERNKSCQTEDGVQWIWDYCQNHSVSANFERDYGVSDVETSGNPSRNASSRSSIDAGIGSEEPPSTPKHHQSFLSHFLHGSSNVHRDKDKSYSAPGSPALNATNSNAAGGTTMQKSKSSSNVVHHGSRLVAKKIWKSRSKSTSRAANLPAACWTPQGKCTWAGTGGRRVTLQDIPLRALTEVERKVLCRVAVAKLQALNLGVHIRPPAESLTGGSIASKPKRRPYLLKRKAITTGLFDNRSKDDKQDKESSGGLVFGIPLSQCIENERLARISVGEVPEVGTLRRSSGHGSRTSFSSLIESPTTVSSKTDEGGSSESISSKGGGVGVLTGSDSGVLELTSDNTCEYDAVPAIVRQCIRHLETNGLSTLGVFRVSPSKKRVRQLREDFDFGRETKIGPDQCPHDVAALLKEYFRDLPDPLLCRDLYQAFVHTQKIRNRRLQQEALQHLIQLLPTTNRETLWVLLNFLTQVAAHSEDHKNETGEPVPGNKMDITNLATVFAPNILHCVKPGQVRPEVSVERAEERIDVINVVRTLLEHASTLFTVPAALLDELYLHMMDSHPAELDLALSRRAEEQSTDDLDHCSEAEIYPVDAENLPLAATTSSTTSTTTSSGTTTTTTTTRKVWTREECLHQSAGVGGDIGPKPRRPKRPGTRRSKIGESNRSNSVDSGSSEDPVEARRKSSPMVITASLTIPMSGAFTLNLDDPDIPYIEESLKQPSAPPRRQRQRSISGCSEGGRHGSDSAVGSSATLSWDQIPSSPPSWASSPPASPDSAVTAVSYIPELQTSSSSAAILQRISFNNSSSVDQQGTTAQRQSTGASARMTATQEVSSVNPPYTPSITSIGGAVMRSKTADIERILHIGKPELASTTSSTVSKNVTSSETKKYTKRRYTDSRHQTRHIPDAESLITTSSSLSLASSSTSTTTITNANALSSSSSGRSAPVWKRRELISSAPKDRQGFL